MRADEKPQELLDWERADAQVSSRQLTHRRQLRWWIAWAYMLSVSGASFAFVIREWDPGRIEWLLKWSLLFLTPGCVSWMLQAARRRFVILDAGPLVACFPPQRVGPVPRWLFGGAYFAASALPFSVLIFRDGHLLVLATVALAAVLLFAIAWLWYDGIPVECRKRGLVIDGVRWIPWQALLEVEPTKRSNRLLAHYRVLPLAVRRGEVPETPILFEEPHESRAQDEPREAYDGFERASRNAVAERLQRRSRPSRPHRRTRTLPIFVCAEDRDAFLQCVRELWSQAEHAATRASPAVLRDEL